MLCRNLVCRDHAGKIAVAHHLHPGQFLRRAGVDRLHLRVEAIGPQYRAKQHAGPHHIRWIDMLTRDEVAPLGLGNRRSGNLPDDLHQVLAVSQLAITQLPLRFWVAHFSVCAYQCRRICIPARSSGFDQHLPRGHCHSAQFRSHRGSGPAAKRPHVVGDEGRISHHHLNRVKRNAQLFGHLLRERRPNVLAHLHFPGEHLYRAIGGNVQPGAQVLGQRMLAKASAGFLRQRSGIRKANEQPAAEDLQKSAAIQLPSARRSRRAALEEFTLELGARAHRVAPSVPACAARLIAARMRG